MNLNKVIIIGRLVRDPELKAIPSGSKVTSVSIATSRTWKDKSGSKQEETEFHNCVAWGKTAEIIAQYMKKGHIIMIEGRLQTRSWEKDGVKRYTTEIMIETMQMGPKVAGAKSEPKKEDEDYPDLADNSGYNSEQPKDIPF